MAADREERSSGAAESTAEERGSDDLEDAHDRRESRRRDVVMRRRAQRRPAQPGAVAAKASEAPPPAAARRAAAWPAPDLRSEYDSMARLIESRLGRDLRPAEINRLMGLVSERVGQLQRRQLLLQQKAHQEAERQLL